MNIYAFLFTFCSISKPNSVFSFNNVAIILKLKSKSIGKTIFHSIPTSLSLSSSSLSSNSHENNDSLQNNNISKDSSRRKYLKSIVGSSMLFTLGVVQQPGLSYGYGDDNDTTTAIMTDNEAQVVLTGEIKKLFDEGRVLETQGKIQAAARIYTKVTNIVPNFIYGWSSLGNTQVVSGNLNTAETSYTNAITLCKENLKKDKQLGIKSCDDLYVLLLNRGAVRLNNDKPILALEDLEASYDMRGKPDAIIAQNRARARELNNKYALADRDYEMAISMTSNEVSPFWLRASMVKFQLGDSIGALDLLRRVEVKFPEAPEVRAALAAILWKKGDEIKARQKFLEIPDRARLNFSNKTYLMKTVSWPPAMIDTITSVATAVGDM